MLTLFRSIFAPPRHLILLLVAAWLGDALASKHAGNAPGMRKAADALAGSMLIGFLLGGRALYLVAHIPAFVQSPISLISLNTDLFDAWGGALCAAIAGWVVMRRERVGIWKALDLITPLLAMLAIGVSLSDLAAGTAFGSETNAPWAITLWGAQRHPTQIYELIVGVIALVVVWMRPRDSAEGSSFLWWAALSAGGRLITEAFRGDSRLVLGGLRLAQVVAWVVLAAALAGLELLEARSGPKVPQVANAENDEATNSPESKRAAPSNRRAR
jgi:phosphatidylglycerol---prolipoprotein diacylglyceryl transferase